MTKLMIGDKFKKARKELGLTQDEVCKKVCLSKIYYSNIERGVQIPKLETFIRIANTLKVTELLDDYLMPRKINEFFHINEMEDLTTEEFTIIRDIIYVMVKNYKK